MRQHEQECGDYIRFPKAQTLVKPIQDENPEHYLLPYRREESSRENAQPRRRLLREHDENWQDPKHELNRVRVEVLADAGRYAFVDVNKCGSAKSPDYEEHRDVNHKAGC